MLFLVRKFVNKDECKMLNTENRILNASMPFFQSQGQVLFFTPHLLSKSVCTEKSSHILVIFFG